MSTEEIRRITIIELIIFIIYGLVTNTFYMKEFAREHAYINELTVSQANIQKESEERLQTQIEELQVIVSENAANVEWSLAEVERLQVEENERKLLQYEYEMKALDKIDDLEKWFVEYKDILSRYEGYVDMPKTIYDEYSDEEVRLMCCMVQTEIGGGTFESKVHVADVVWNRIEHPLWPNTMPAVIKQPNQFAIATSTFSESTRLAVEYSYMFPDTTQGALGFHSGPITQKFGSYYFVFNDTYHSFYSEGTK